MLRNLVFPFAALLVQAVAAQTIAGDWRGEVSTPNGAFPLVFHISAKGAAFAGTMDSPAQGANALELSAVKIAGVDVVFELKMAGARFEGKADPTGSRIVGAWVQGGQSIPLTLARIAGGAPKPEPKRPQNPAPPFPYRAEDVVYDNKTAGIQLAGTLTIPPGRGPFTTVLLITGSGPQDRDETIMGHKPFLVLSDYLTRRGVAVLRVDDRGIAKSSGKFTTATTADFATDAEAGVAYLKTRPEVNARKIGLIGHSEGGAIAPMIAARNPDVAFIVLLAGPGIRGDDTIVSQVGALAEASGAPPDIVKQSMDKQRQVVSTIEQEKDPAALRAKLAEIVPADALTAQFAALNSPWYRYFLELDPSVSLRKLKCPVLALNGSKDTQVVAKLNLPAIRKALEEGGNKQFETEELPGLNHLFQTAKTGAVSEYAEIEETISPIALGKVAAWVKKQ